MAFIKYGVTGKVVGTSEDGDPGNEPKDKPEEEEGKTKE